MTVPGAGQSNPEPIQQIIDGVSVISGTTTSDGAALGASLVDASLKNIPDCVTNQATIVITSDPSGLSTKQKRAAKSLNTATGTITPDHNFSGQILAGTGYLLINSPSPTMVADILAIVTSIAGGTYWETFGPSSVEIGDGINAGVTLFDPGGGVIPQANITAGTFTIDQVRLGVVVNIVPSSPSLKMDGAVYTNYNFPAGTWLVGDIAVFTFSGIKVVISGTTTSLPPIQFWIRVVIEPDIQTTVNTINTNQGDPSGDTLKSTTAKLGDLARSLATELGTRWNVSGDLGTDIGDIVDYNALDAIYFDPNNGGTIVGGFTGSPDKPLSTEAEVISQLLALDLSKVVIPASAGTGNPTFNLPHDVTGISFYGEQQEYCYFNLSGFAVSGCKFENLSILGNNSASALPSSYRKCSVNMNIELASDVFYDCNISGISSVGNVAPSPTFVKCDFNICNVHADGATFLNCSGGVTVFDNTVSTVTVFGNALDLTIDVTCTGGTFYIYGDTSKTNNGTSALVDKSINAIVDTVNTNQGNPSGDVLTSTTTKIGNLARSLATELGTKWDISGDLGTDITSILSYINGISQAVSVVGSPFSLLNNILEQDAIIVTAGTQQVDIELDLSNLTQSNTIREYVQTDGSNYRQVSAKVFPASFDTGTTCVTLSFPQKNTLYKVTMQASVLEGSARNVPFRILTRSL